MQYKVLMRDVLLSSCVKLPIGKELRQQRITCHDHHICSYVHHITRFIALNVRKRHSSNFTTCHLNAAEKA